MEHFFFEISAEGRPGCVVWASCQHSSAIVLLAVPSQGRGHPRKPIMSEVVPSRRALPEYVTPAAAAGGRAQTSPPRWPASRGRRLARRSWCGHRPAGGQAGCNVRSRRRSSRPGGVEGSRRRAQARSQGARRGSWSRAPRCTSASARAASGCVSRSVPRPAPSTRTWRMALIFRSGYLRSCIQTITNCPVVRSAIRNQETAGDKPSFFITTPIY